MPSPDPLPGLLARLVALVRAPGALMALCRVRPVFAGALVLGVVGTVLLSLPTMPLVVDDMIQRIWDSPDVPAEERERIGVLLEDNERALAVSLALAAGFGAALTVFFWSGILHLGTSMTLGTPEDGLRVSFRHLLAVTAHANLVNLPGLALGTLLTLATGTLVPAVSLAWPLGLEITTTAGVLAAWVSPINFWWLFLLGIGVRVLYRAPIGISMGIPLALSIGFRVLQSVVASIGGAPAPGP